MSRIKIPASQLLVTGPLSSEAGVLLRLFATEPTPLPAELKAIHPSSASTAHAKEVPRIAAKTCHVPSESTTTPDVISFSDVERVA